MEFSQQFFYTVGRWLGDGHCTKGDVSICCNASETVDLRRKITGALKLSKTGQAIAPRESHEGSVHHFVFGNQALASWLTQNFGACCEGKHIPAWCLGMQRSWRAALLQGYVDADGHTTRRIDAVSVSKALALGIRLLATSLGYSPSFFTCAGRAWNIEGRSGDGAQQWRTAWTVDLQRKTGFRDSLHLFTRVKSVKETGIDEDVYNLQVEDDESYTADGIVVHNCTHHSVARGGKPVNEQSRATAWCVIRWIRHKRPTHVLVENVWEFREWGPLKQKRKDGKPVWVRLYKYQVVSPKTKRVRHCEKKIETTEIPFKQNRGEDRRDWLKRLSAVGYEMSLIADKSKKGRIFNKWVREMRRMGYRVEWKRLCSADYGDPTSRRRLFVQAVAIESGRKIVWPNPTHCKRDKNGGVPPGLKPWRVARDIIDWSNPGESIFTRRRPLAKTTLFRIATGLIKYGLKEFIVPKDQGWDGQAVKSVDDPVSTLTTNHRGEGLARPGIIPLEPYQVPNEGVFGGNQPASVDEPVKTVTAAHGAGSVAQPFLVQMMGKSTAQSADDPVTAIVGGPKHYLVNPKFLVKLRGTGRSNSVDLPVDTISAGGEHHGLVNMLVEAFMMATDQSGGNGSQTYSADDPVHTTVTKANQAVVNPRVTPLPASVIQVAHGASRAGEEYRVKSPDEPLGSLTAGGTSFGVLQPNLQKIHGRHYTERPAEPADELVMGINAESLEKGDQARGRRPGKRARGNRNSHAIDGDTGIPKSPADRDDKGGTGNPSSVPLCIIPNFGEAPGQAPRVHSVDEPIPTVTGHGAGGLVSGYLTPFIIGTAHAGDDGRVASILEPLATVCGNRGDRAVIRPWFYTYYSSGATGQSIDEPVPTARTHDSLGLCYPVLEFNGQFYILDLRFRMLSVRELARAQGFPDSFEFPGTKTDAVKAIGNSVSCGVARALVLATETQVSDITAYET
jgi:DNA (cytosine-5)-methyltransferase 1